MLLQQPDLLLLDEPTNHLDAESVAWLERHLQEYPGTVVAVTHDRYFLDNVAEWILELDRGRGYPVEGQLLVVAGAEAGAAGQGGEAGVGPAEGAGPRAGMGARWPRGPASPRARPASAPTRSWPAQEYEEREDELVMQIPPGPHLGDLVVRAEGVRKGYGDNLLMEDLNFDLPRGGIVGVIGPNGAGKTTLFRMIVGQEKPDGGKLRVGETVDAGLRRSEPRRARRRQDGLRGDHRRHRLPDARQAQGRARAATSPRFNFKGPDQQRKVGELSGGERNRVHLAKLLRRGGNLLLLDEPTNDLDVDTLRALEEALLNFGGCAVVISHDRWFLDRIATHILAFEGDSKTVWCEGNYQTYEAQRKQRLGVEADQPHRIRYKKLHQ